MPKFTDEELKASFEKAKASPGMRLVIEQSLEYLIRQAASADPKEKRDGRICLRDFRKRWTSAGTDLLIEESPEIQRLIAKHKLGPKELGL